MGRPARTERTNVPPGIQGPCRWPATAIRISFRRPEPAKGALADHPRHRAAAWINRSTDELLFLYPVRDVAHFLLAGLGGVVTRCCGRVSADASRGDWQVRTSRRPANPQAKLPAVPHDRCRDL